MGFIVPAPDSPRAHAQALIERKDALQAELAAQFSILAAQSSTMHSPLVDRDGFPRGDIDVFAVRHARVRVIELRNDLDAVVDEIARALETVHSRPPAAAAAAAVVVPPAPEASELDSDGRDVDLRPFAKVDGVAPGSPAASAGLQREDILLQFGRLRASDFPSSSLQPLAEMVAQFENRPLEVKVRRAEEVVSLTFTPRKGWGGRGLLGCHIVPHS